METSNTQKLVKRWASLLMLVPALGALCGLPGAATAQEKQQGQDWEYPSAVSTFARMCLMPGVNPADRVAALEADSGWREDTTVTADIPKMSVSKAISRNYSFINVASARQWSGEIDGRTARFVIATFNGKVRYPNLCALVLEGPQHAMTYSKELKAAFKTFGIGGKSVDLVHYFEYAGKIGAEKHPVRGEIFTRSRSGQVEKTTHIYVAY